MIVAGALGAGVFILAMRPSEPKLIVPLADGSRLELIGTDFGRQLYYGGGRWQRFICKAIGYPLPSFVHNQPAIWPSIYTNGIALYFRRSYPNGIPLDTSWNGSGQFYVLDDFAGEHIIPNHAVVFRTGKRGQNEVVLDENMHWELPMSPDHELRLRIRETNDLTGLVSTHDFQIKNPAW